MMKIINREALAIDKASFLGKGSFGIVKKGQYQFGDVAIKEVMCTDLSSKEAQRFFQEVEIMAKLQHPNIISFYGYTQEKPYLIVMEYMSRGSLFEVLKNDDITKDVGQTLKWAKQISAGLNHLHAQEPCILHRDLKSPNVLVNAHYDLKLTDFGSALVKLRSNVSTLTTSAASHVGSVRWMAPELLNLKPKYSCASDMFALAIIFWELASREIPYPDVGDNSIIRTCVQNGERPDIDNIEPPFFKSLIESCWAQDPASRPSVQHVIEILETHQIPVQAEDSAAQQDTELAVEGIASGPDLQTTTALSIAQKNTTGNEVFALPLQITCSELPESFIDSAQPMEDIMLLLQHVAYGKQDEAEAMIKADPTLLLNQGKVVDYSGRTFEQITAFQYALWALDWHMWEMILKYLSPEHAKKQFLALEENGSGVHGRHYDFNELIIPLQNVNDEELWNEQNPQCITEMSRDEYWCRRVGGAQTKVPAHVANQYCSARRFVPKPNFMDVLPRTLQLKQQQGFWYPITKIFNLWTLGENAAMTRGGHDVVARFDYSNLIPCDFVSSDLQAMIELSTVRHLQLAILSYSYIDRDQWLKKNYQKLLLYVAWGEQDKAETLLKLDVRLLLYSGEITDYSHRTFKNITAFQYALWALDWHMWQMLLKYLPEEEARNQFNALEEAAGPHGKHYDFKDIIDSLNGLKEIREYYPDYRKSDNTVLDKLLLEAWKRLAVSQVHVPVHIANQYFQDFDFQPLPNFADFPLKRILQETKLFGASSVPCWYPIATIRGMSFGKKCALVKSQSYLSEIDVYKGGYDSWGALWAAAENLLAMKALKHVCFSQLTILTKNNLEQFLIQVVYGKYDAVERMLKADSNLLLYSGTVTDYSGRIFKNITAFQYALWALDWHMWQIFLKYLPEEEARKQFDEFEKEEIKEYGNYFDLNEIIQILTPFYDNDYWSRLYNTKEQENIERERYFVEVIGAAQKILPVQVIALYLNKNFYDALEKFFYNLSDFKFLLEENQLGVLNQPCRLPAPDTFFDFILRKEENDLKFIKLLRVIQLSYLEELRARFTNTEKWIADRNKRFLSYVAQGKQSYAEVMVKEDPTLLSYSGEVIDFSNRTFKSITAFQYAVWALDWHMWQMLLKYLSIEHATKQLRELLTQSTEHGRHYNFNDLLATLEEGLQLFSYSSQSTEFLCKIAVTSTEIFDRDFPFAYCRYNKVLNKYLCEVIGGAQKRVPAHVAGEYSCTNRRLRPVPSFTEKALPYDFAKENNHYFSNNDKAEYKVGKNCLILGCISGEKITTVKTYDSDTHMPVNFPFKEDYITSLKAMQKLYSVRIEQFENLKKELLPDFRKVDNFFPNPQQYGIQLVHGDFSEYLLIQSMVNFLYCCFHSQVVENHQPLVLSLLSQLKQVGDIPICVSYEDDKEDTLFFKNSISHVFLTERHKSHYCVTLDESLLLKNQELFVSNWVFATWLLGNITLRKNNIDEVMPLWFEWVEQHTQTLNYNLKESSWYFLGCLALLMKDFRYAWYCFQCMKIIPALIETKLREEHLSFIEDPDIQKVTDLEDKRNLVRAKIMSLKGSMPFPVSCLTP